VSLLTSRVSLLATRVSLLASRMSMLASRVSLLASRMSLLASRVSLLATRVSLLATRVSMLATRVSLLTSRVSLLTSLPWYASTYCSNERYKITLYRKAQYTLCLSLSLSGCCGFLGVYTNDIRPGSETGLVLYWRLIGSDMTILMTETNQISKMSHFEPNNHNTA